MAYDGPFFFFGQAGLNIGDKISGYFAYDYLEGSDCLKIEAGYIADQMNDKVAHISGDRGWTPFEYKIPGITDDPNSNPDSWWLAASLGFDEDTLTEGVFLLMI